MNWKYLDFFPLATRNVNSRKGGVFFYPLGRPSVTVTASSNRYVHKCNALVRPSQNFIIKRKLLLTRQSLREEAGHVDHWWLLSCSLYFFRSLHEKKDFPISPLDLLSPKLGEKPYLLSLSRSRGISVNKRTVTRHSCSLLWGIRIGHIMSSCLFSFSLIGHILA